VKSRSKEESPVPVPARANPAGEVRARWVWVEPTIWTDRMLSALEKGVRGGRWHSLIDKVYDPRNLESAFRRVQRNKGGPGADNQTIEMFEKNLTRNLEWIHVHLRDRDYTPQRIKRTWIPKPGRKRERRPLGIPTVRDRVTQTALRNVLEPIFEHDFAPHSYGFRPGRGCKDALRRVAALLARGYPWVVDADLKSYFDTIDHDLLMTRVREKVADGRVLDLTRRFLNQGTVEGMASWTPERGAPQGAVISPLLSNIYLHPLDKLMAENGYEMVRYADDFVILCRDEESAERALEIARRWTEEAQLTLHPDKTRIIDARERGGFDFLGYHFERGYRWPSKKSERNLRDRVREKTKRCHGYCLERIIRDVNRITRGWYEYYKHSHKNSFKSLDSWIRMRLRSILRKRHKGRGRGRGLDHFKWPNSYFAKLGLLSLHEARATDGQSARR